MCGQVLVGGGGWSRVWWWLSMAGQIWVREKICGRGERAAGERLVVAVVVELMATRERGSATGEREREKGLVGGGLLEVKGGAARREINDPEQDEHEMRAGEKNNGGGVVKQKP
ncbi:hypothetical protein HAX54_020307 [Datura stramonium]|uniref:Uncharacterized protein n=1 Tax=Datura stramonium TaxID=4076 RepID=A0ABS8UQT8_DATST|nr:hypothetical protein [Datura stramonium]